MRREVLLVHPGGPYWAKRDEGAWSIPKGEYEEGGARPAPAPCASSARSWGRRPTLDPEALIDLGSVRQKAGKVVDAWAAEADFDPAAAGQQHLRARVAAAQRQRAEFPEVDRAEWFEPERAREKILPAQAELIDRLLERLAGAEGGGGGFA